MNPKYPDAIDQIVSAFAKQQARIAELEAALDSVLDYAQDWIDQYHVSMRGYRPETHAQMDADIAKARAVLARKGEEK